MTSAAAAMTQPASDYVSYLPGVSSLPEPMKPWQAGVGLLSRAWRWIRARQTAQKSTRRLRVAETVSLGEKRFVAVIQVDGKQFLVGGGPNGVTLLAMLDGVGDFENQAAGAQTAKKATPKKPASKKRAPRASAKKEWTVEPMGEQQ